MKFSTHPLSPDLALRRDLQAAPLDLELANRLRSSLADTLAQGQALADDFYAELLSRFPEWHGRFRADMDTPKQQLLQTFEWIVRNLDRPTEVRLAARELGKRYEGFGVKPEHYPVFRDILVESMAKMANGKWSRELEADWRLAIDLLSALMLGEQHHRAGDRTRA